MLKEIIDGIAIRLNQEFGDDFAIYTESVEQGLNEPCFFIFMLQPSQEQVIGKRYFRQQPFDVHYFPSTKDKNSEIVDVIDRMQDCLEYIQVGSDTLRGTSINFEVVGGILHCFVNYNMYVIKQADPEDPMETIQVESTTKG
jgi:hypothetical protein